MNVEPGDIVLQWFIKVGSFYTIEREKMYDLLFVWAVQSPCETQKRILVTGSKFPGFRWKSMLVDDIAEFDVV